jgi:hypothetical protein
MDMVMDMFLFEDMSNPSLLGPKLLKEDGSRIILEDWESITLES